MPGLGLNFQAVVLAGGEDKRMYPLTSTTLKAFLPVANKPLISYSLRMLSDAGLKHVFVVASGEKAAGTITHWLGQDNSVPSGLTCEVVVSPEGVGTAGALRCVASRLSSSTLVVLSGDLVTDMSLAHMVAEHQLAGAGATMMLATRKTSPVAGTKPGKPPTDVDYIGLDASRSHLLFYATSPEVLRELRVPMSAVRAHGNVEITSSLVDAHLYVFNRSVLKLLADHPNMMSLRQDFLPFLAAQQYKRPQPPVPSLEPTTSITTPIATDPARGITSNAASSTTLRYDEDDESFASSLPGADYLSLSHMKPGDNGRKLPNSCRVVVAQPDTYCGRVSNLHSYVEVNKELADANTALHLADLKASKHDNVVPLSTVIGHKTTVAAACILGEACVLGDKTSIKRSVLGCNCRLGNNVKIINSVLMDGILIGDNCHIQNSILCSGAQIQAGATVKDCQIGAGYVVAGGVEYKEEVLAKK